MVRNAALDRNVRVKEAAAKAAAGNMARERTQQIGRDLRGQAIAVGQRYPQQSIEEAKLAAGIGTGAVENVSQTGVTGAEMQGGAIPWASATTNAYGRANEASANIWGAMTNQNAMDAASDPWGNVMGLAGNIAGAYASRPSGATGGEVVGPGGPTDDAVQANVSDGEYVVPAHGVRKKGTDFFDKLIEKSKQQDDERAKMRQTGAIPAHQGGGPTRGYILPPPVSQQGIPERAS
jgi:hypothetical protein